MPLVRFKIRNELSLGVPELNRSAAVENEEPKAILGAVEVAGLVGILRQLGDLAEFSAEVFNGIQEEVTVTASRCQKLTSRVKRIESALSPLEKAVLSQTSHIHFAYTAGCEWHPRIRNGQRHFVQSDLPLCVMETYEQCRDPPPLHLLDRFDVGGPGSCLRKYSDPTFFRKELGNPSTADDIKGQRDQAHRKRKKKRLPQRNICRSRAVSTSDETNGARLSSLTDDRQTTSHSTSTVDMPRSSNMQDLSDIIDESHLQGQSDAQEHSEAQVQSDFQESSKPRDSVTGSGFIEYFINQSPVDKTEVNLVKGFLSGSLQHADRIRSAVPEGCIEVIDDNTLYSPSEDIPVPHASIVCDAKKETLELRIGKSNKDDEASEIHESKFGPGTPDRSRQNQRDFDRTYIFFDEVDFVGEKQSKSQANSIDGKPGIENEGENKSEQGSEADEFVDAHNTIESESESENDGVQKPKLEHYFGDISTYCSEDDNIDNNGGSEDIPYEKMTDDLCQHSSVDESCSGSYLPKDATGSCCLSDPVCGKTLSHDETFQKPREYLALPPSLLAEEAFPVGTFMREEPSAAHSLLAGDCVHEKISSEESISSCPSLKDAIPAEKILPQEHLVNHPSLAEAVPNEKILPGESAAKYPSFAEISLREKMLPEKSLPKIQSLAVAVPVDMTPAEERYVAHPSSPEAVQEKKVSLEILDLKKFSVPEVALQKQISLKEFADIYTCLAETAPDERFLTGEPDEPATTCLSLTKEILIEKLLPEKPLEGYQYVADLPKENIPQEKSVVSTHPSCAKATPEENLSLEVLGSTNVSVPEAVPQEQIGLEDFVGIDPCSAEAAPAERVFPEEPVTRCVSLTNVITVKALPEELLEIYPFLAELPEEKISLEEPYVALPSSLEAVQEKKVSVEVLDSKKFSVPEAALQKQISLKEFADIYTCLAETAPDERFLTGEPDEPATTCLSLTKEIPIEKLLPEKPLERYQYVAELPKENILQEKSVVSTHPSCAKATPEENLSLEVLGSTNVSVPEAVPQEQIGLEDFVGIDLCSAESAPAERVFPEEPVTRCVSLTNVSTVKALPEELLEMHPSLAELPEEKISLEESDDATHPSEAVSDEKISPEVYDCTNLSLDEALPQKQISLDEFVGNPWLAEAVPEEPVTKCLSLTKAATVEGVFPEKPLEKYRSFAELPEGKILHEEANYATHPSLSEAVSNEPISLEVLDSTNLPLVAAVPQEQIAHEEIFGIEPCLAEAVLLEEPVTTCISLTKVVPIIENLPEEPLEAYASSLENLPKDKISQEKSDDATHPFCAKAESDEMVSPEVFDSTNMHVAAAVLHEQISLEGVVGIDPCWAEAVLLEEPVTTYISLTKMVPTVEVLPEEPLEVYASLENFPKNKISQEKSDDATHPYCAKAEYDEIASPEVLDSTNLYVAEAIPREQVALEGFVGIDPCLAEAVTDERALPEEPVTTCMYLTKAAPTKKTLPVEPLEVYPSSEELLQEMTLQAGKNDDATHPSFSEAVGDEKISPLEGPVSTYPSLVQSVPYAEEDLFTNPLLDLAVPNERSFPDEPGLAYQSSAEAGFKEKNLPEEPLPACPSLEDAVRDEKISLEELDATCPLSAETVFVENVSGSEAHRSIIEAGPHNKTFPEEPVATYLSLAEAVFDEKTPGLEAPGSTTEVDPHNKTFPEEPASAAYLALADGIPDQKVFLDDAAFLSFAEAIFGEKFSPEVPDSKHPSLSEPEMPVTPPSLVTEGEAYDEPYTASNVSMNQKSGFLEPESVDRTIQLSGGTVTVSSGTQESLSNGTSSESISIWSNGGLLGLAPSKPPVFAEPSSVSEHIQNEINEASVHASRKPESSSKSVEDTEKSSLSLVISDPTSPQRSNMLNHSNGSPLSHLQSTATSFKVFGLSHRLLMAGFGGNSSSTCESIPTTSYDTDIAAIKDKTQQIPCGSRFEEQLDYESCLFGSPTSSPPVEHMRISFNTKDVSSVSKLKLRIPCQPQYGGENAEMIPSFQLVQEASNSDDDEDSSDIFCQTSTCVSDNCLSDSELWESDESTMKSVSSLKQVGERSRHGDMGSLAGSFLDLPCFDGVDHQSTSSRLDQEEEQEQVVEYKPSVSEIIRGWPPNQQKSSPSSEANADAVLKKTQIQSDGL